MNNKIPEEVMAEVTDFDKCPVCKNSSGLATTLYQGQVKRGFVKKRDKYGIYEFSGPIVDLKMIQHGKLLPESKVPFISVTIDVCTNPDCGVLFATRIVKYDVLVKDIQITHPTNVPSILSLGNIQSPFIKG